MIKLIPNFAAAVATTLSVSNGAITTNNNTVASSNGFYSFSFADQTPATPAAQSAFQSFQNIYGWLIKNTFPNYPTIIANLPQAWLEAAWNKYNTSRPPMGWIEPNNEWYANPALLENIIQTADSSSTIKPAEKKFVDLLRPVLALSKITAKALSIQRVMNFRYGNNSTDSNAATILEDFKNFTWARYSANDYYLEPVETSMSWVYQPYGAVAQTFKLLDDCTSSLIQDDKTNAPLNEVNINSTINGMNAQVSIYQNDLLVLLKKYKLIDESVGSDIRQGLAGSGSGITSSQIDSLLETIQNKVPSIDPSRPDDYLKLIGLAQALDKKDFSNLQNLPQSTIDKLQNLSKNFDLSSLSSSELSDLMNSDLENKIDWSKIDLDHLDVNNLDFKHLESLNKLQNLFKAFAGASVAQKIIMGFGAGIAAILAGTMGRLSALLVKQKASGRSKVFTVSATAALLIITVGLIAGIFVG